MKTIRTCPLGHTCEKIVDDHIEICMWFTEIAGIDGQGKNVTRKDCAIALQPFLQIEAAMSNRGQTQAIESLRNETIKRQDLALGLVQNVRNIES